MVWKHFVVMAQEVTLLHRFISHPLLASLVASIFTVAPVSAQQTTATLVGTASDLTGGVIPEVAVKATNRETNVSREVKTGLVRQLFDSGFAGRRVQHLRR